MPQKKQTTIAAAVVFNAETKTLTRIESALKTNINLVTEEFGKQGRIWVENKGVLKAAEIAANLLLCGIEVSKETLRCIEIAEMLSLTEWKLGTVH